ncbi:NAD(P)/FAD-dependent oxidoreductase [Actinophytocola gossypii]|nr:FAD-dependent oxidoreductase [Actinophytocola gossypii]
MGRIAVVGAGLAGLRTVERLRRLGHAGPVTLVGAEEHPPYDRPPLSKAVLASPEAARPPLREEDYAALDVDLRLGTHATGVDGHRLLLSSGEVEFDRLVVATGVRPRRPAVFDGWSGVHVLRDWADCVGLRTALAAGRSLVVVGAGVLGCEVAATARGLGLDVSVVERLAHPLPLGPAVGAHLAALHRANGVTLRCGAEVTGLKGDGRVAGVELADGTVLPADVVVVAVGSTPNTEWLSGSDVPVDDGVLCDRTGRTARPDVWAAGDVARMPHPWRAGTVRFEHWTGAVDTAGLVAANLLADEPKPLAAVPYFWTDQYGLRLQAIGLPDPADEFEVVQGAVEDGKFLAHYRRDGVLTGAAAMGMPGPLAKTRRLIGTG